MFSIPRIIEKIGKASCILQLIPGTYSQNTLATKIQMQPVVLKLCSDRRSLRNCRPTNIYAGSHGTLKLQARKLRSLHTGVIVKWCEMRYLTLGFTTV